MQLIPATPRPLILASALALGAAYFAARFPNMPGASAGAYVSTFLIALPSAVRALPLPRLAPGYALPARALRLRLRHRDRGRRDRLPLRFLLLRRRPRTQARGLVPYLLPVSYAPLVVGAVAASWGSQGAPPRPGRRPAPRPDRRRPRPGRRILGLLDLARKRTYYGVPASNFAGWLLSWSPRRRQSYSPPDGWRSSPPPGLLDSAIIALSFWTGVAALSSMVLPTLLGIALSVYLLGRRSRLRAAKQ
jgi:putative membrane protein